MNKSTLFLLFLALSVHVNAQLEFQENVIIETTEFIGSPACVAFGNMDGDGDMDVLYSALDGTLAWFKNLDGLGDFGTKQVISTNNIAKEIITSDVDNDGDLDIILTSTVNNKLVWYQNLDGLGSFGAEQAIAISAFNATAEGIFAADIDNDGDVDILYIYYWGVGWVENIDGQGNFGNAQLFTTNITGGKDVFAADLDNDGDMDVLSASSVDNKIIWYENLDGQGTFGSQQLIITNAIDPYSVSAADIDNDGDMDVLSASDVDNKIAWYENLDGNGNFGSVQIITQIAVNAQLVSVADMDGDGDLDVLHAGKNHQGVSAAWYENTDGQGNFGSQQVIREGDSATAFVFATDLNGDGDLDVLSASRSDNKIIWHENIDGLGTFTQELRIPSVLNDQIIGPRSVCAIDIDGDGDIDVLSASIIDNKIAWYQNLDGLGNFGTAQIITTDLLGALFVSAADIDGDGDMDVLSLSNIDDKVAWYENIDGLGNFGSQQVISTNLIYPRYAEFSDLDGDGDLDILSSSNSNDAVVWFSNDDGQGNFVNEPFITANAFSTIIAKSVDMDGDGDQDVVYGNYGVVWKANDSQGNFGNEQIINYATSALNYFSIADINADGDNDVITFNIQDDELLFQENLNGLGGFGFSTLIDTNIATMKNMNVVDIDGDGDLDIVSTLSDVNDYSEYFTVFYENINGQGDFGNRYIIQGMDYNFPDIDIADINGDGKLDLVSCASSILSGEHKISWHENQGTLSVSEFDTNKILIYPNPANNILNIQGQTVVETITIYDINGRLLKAINARDKKVAVDVSELSEGMYFIALKSGKKRETKKFIKK